MNSILILLFLIMIAFLVAFLVYKKTKYWYPFIVVSGLGTICMIVLTIIYSYDVFLLPQNGNHDGIPITGIMRVLSGKETFNTFDQKFSGIVNGIVIILMLLIAFVIFSMQQRIQKKDNN